MIYSVQTQAIGCEVEGHELVQVNLEHPVTLTARSHAGARAVSIVLCGEDTVMAHWHVELRQGETEIKFTLELTNERVRLNAGGRNVYFLPTAERFLPPKAQFAGMASASAVEIVLLIDATMIGHVKEQQFPDPIAKKLVEQIPFHNWLSCWVSDCASALQDTGRSLAISLIEFADTKLNQGKADDLMPEFAMFPDVANGIEFSRDVSAYNVEQQCRRLIYSAGGDYVDGVAEALYAIADSWNGDAYKLLVVLGNSPGFSIKNPVSTIKHVAANIAIRSTTLEDATYRLAAKGVSVSSVYLSDEFISDLMASLSEEPMGRIEDQTAQVASMRLKTEMAQSVEHQYRREIASVEALHYSAYDWNASSTIDVLDRKDLISARRVTYPIEVTAV